MFACYASTRHNLCHNSYNSFFSTYSGSACQVLCGTSYHALHRACGERSSARSHYTFNQAFSKCIRARSSRAFRNRPSARPCCATSRHPSARFHSVFSNCRSNTCCYIAYSNSTKPRERDHLL